MRIYFQLSWCRSYRRNWHTSLKAICSFALKWRFRRSIAIIFNEALDVLCECFRNVAKKMFQETPNNRRSMLSLQFTASRFWLLLAFFLPMCYILSRLMNSAVQQAPCFESLGLKQTKATFLRGVSAIWWLTQALLPSFWRRFQWVDRRDV